MNEAYSIQTWIRALDESVGSEHPRGLLIKVLRSMRNHSQLPMFQPSSPIRCGLWNAISGIEAALTEDELLDVKARTLIASAVLLALLEVV